MNQALLGKIGWRLHAQDKGLWAKIYDDKYLKGHSILDNSLDARHDCSSTWKGILHGSKLLKQGMTWRIGMGDKVKFWLDKWLSDVPLAQYEEIGDVLDLDCHVSSFFRHGWWDIERLRNVVPEWVVQKIISFPAGFNSNLQDSQIWKHTANGVYTVKSAYQLLFGDSSWNDPFWKVLWQENLPPKLIIFLWLVFYDKILTNDQRVRRNLSSDPSCSICDWSHETTLHILRDCPKAREVWSYFLPPRQQANFFYTDFQPWLKNNILSKASWSSSTSWCSIFVFICWYLWKWRNQSIFTAEEVTALNPRHVILLALSDWNKASCGDTTAREKVQIFLTWEPPNTGIFKLNVDGSCKPAYGNIGAGGVLRDSSGNWIMGFAVNLGIGQVLEAELWGLFFGLKMALDKGVNMLIIEMDSALCVQLIQQTVAYHFHPLAGLLHSCGTLLRQLENYQIQHVYREKNYLADCLARWSYNLDLGICFFENTPVWANDVLVDDLIGAPRARQIPIDKA